MPTPVMTDIYRAQVVLPSKSGMPEDVFTNTWHFRNDTVGAPPFVVAGVIQNVLNAFYAGADASGNTLNTYLSPTIDRAAAMIHCYDLGQAAPRTKYSVPLVLPAVAGTKSPLPAEVAVVLSFFGDFNTRRYRNRIYVGPLEVSAVAAHTSSEHDARVSSTLRNILSDRAGNVAGTSENVTWVTLSHGGTAPPIVPAFTSVVQEGWIDNAFDIQRRRGLKASVRQGWPS